MNKLYYAHSMKIYNSKEEKSNIETIKELYPNYEIINPSTMKWKGDMQQYLNAIDEAKLVVVTEYMGHIGKGAYEEVKYALSKNYPVRCLWNQMLFVVDTVEVVDKDNWAITYARLIIEPYEHL